MDSSREWKNGVRVLEIRQREGWNEQEFKKTSSENE